MRRSLMDDITMIAKGKFDFDDDLDEILDGKKKKKKKKKAKKEKAGSGNSKLIAYKESLKSLSKKELKAKMEALGVSVPSWEMDDKKAMRKAILKAVKNKETKAYDMKVDDGSKSDLPGGLKLVAEGGKKVSSKKKDHICYFDEDTHDFVITDAMDRTDVEVFNSMRTLGKLRQSIRTDDGFGELMDRISAKLLQSDTKKLDTSDENIIDVEYTVVDEDTTEKAALPEPSKEEDSEADDVSKDVERIVGKKKKK